MFPDFFERAMDESQSTASETASVSSSAVFVVSIGGSLFMQENALDTEAIQRIAVSINSLALEGYKFALVVGGGKICRSYLLAAETLGANQFSMDELGIAITRANAFLFIQAISKSFPRPVTDFAHAQTIIEKNQIPILGGMLPGFTTDAVAALLAEKLRGTFVNLSNVNGVYNSNPLVNKRAKLFREVSFEKLFQIAARATGKPGQNHIIDVLAALVVRRSCIPTIFVNGNNLENFDAAVKGRPFNGTVVQTSEAETPCFMETKPIEQSESETIQPDEIER